VVSVDAIGYSSQTLTLHLVCTNQNFDYGRYIGLMYFSLQISLTEYSGRVQMSQVVTGGLKKMAYV